MDAKNFGRALVCASIIGIGAAATPSAASAADFDCYNVGTSSEPNQHEVGEAEGDAYCMGVGSANVTITESSPDVTVTGNGTGYAYVTYTGSSQGPTQYTFDADTNGTDTQSFTAYVENRAATNDPPQCLGPQSGDGEALPIGTETFAAGCFDDEGETGDVTLSVVGQPSRGTLRIDNSDAKSPLLQYRAGCSGTDSFSFKASDGVNTTQVYTGGSRNADGVPCSTPPAAPVAKPANPAPAVTFSLKKVPSTIQIAANGTAVIPVTGTPGSRGSVAVSSDKAIASARKKKKARKAIVKFASKRFTVPASGTAKVKVKVTGKALKALKKAKKVKVKVTIKTDKTTVTKRIVLKAPKAKKRK